MRSLFTMSLLSALICVAAHGTALAADEPEDPTKNDYRLAAAFQNNLIFKLAIPHWEKVIAGSPDKERVEKARYYVAICYFHEKQFKKSVERLKVVLKNNPPEKDKKNAGFRRDAMALLAASHFRLPDEQTGKKTLELFRAEFPDEKKLAKQIEDGTYRSVHERQETRRAGGHQEGVGDGRASGGYGAAVHGVEEKMEHGVTASSF